VNQRLTEIGIFTAGMNSQSDQPRKPLVSIHRLEKPYYALNTATVDPTATF
jgi:hypothetical protein